MKTITETELYAKWLRLEFDDLWSFPDYKTQVRRAGVTVIDDMDPAWKFDRKELGNDKNL